MELLLSEHHDALYVVLELGINRMLLTNMKITIRIITV